MCLNAMQTNANRIGCAPLSHSSAPAGKSSSRNDKQGGFTLVELITVMVIVGILAVVAIPRFFDNSVFESRAAADQVKSALRYAQKVAIASHGPVTANISAGTASNCGAEVTGGVLNCVIKNSVPLGGASTVTFDAIGRPLPNATVTVNVGAVTITVAQETGYVSYVQ